MFRKLSYVLVAFPLLAFHYCHGFGNVPEPASLTLLGLGLIAAGLLIRHSKDAAI